MTGSRDLVVVVDSTGAVLGEEDKLAAHRPPGQLHLAFSVFLFREDGATLVQRRALTKYHFAGYWANACCSHPSPGESLALSATARVVEELGVAATLEAAGSFLYRAVDPLSEMVEHELDHVFVGNIEELPAAPDPAEIDELRFVKPADLNPEHLGGPVAPWVSEALSLALRHRRTAP